MIVTPYEYIARPSFLERYARIPNLAPSQLRGKNCAMDD